MSKIKLLILLLTNIFFASCVNQNISDQKFSLDYIGGEYDGLVLENMLKSKLVNFDKFDQGSIYKIQAKISHSQNLYITNIDNTSDRELISTTLDIKIIESINNCLAYNYSNSVSQYYIYASTDKFLSNQKAVERIKYNNTDEIVQNFMNELMYINISCENE